MAERIVECLNIEKQVKRDDSEETLLEIPYFHIESGEMLAIMGPSGSGKTTLLHFIAGLDRPSTGEVKLFGQSITSRSESKIDKLRGNQIGMVFQQFLLFPHMSALDNVMVQTLAARLEGKRALNRAKSLLERLGVGHRMHVKAGLLSRGEQQRVSVARALLHEPQLLIADEPTGNLDINTGIAVVEWMRAWCAENRSALLIVTHDTDIASRFSRIEHMNQLNKVYTSVPAGVIQ